MSSKIKYDPMCSKRIKMSSSVQLETNPTFIENIPHSFKHLPHSSTTSISNHDSDTESAWSGESNEHDFDIKPDMSSLKVDLSHSHHETHIKKEIEDFNESEYSIHTEFIIKNEPNENVNETLAEPNLVPMVTKVKYPKRHETTEVFLSVNPEIFTKFSGLSDFKMFTALLTYIEDDMREMSNVSKSEQLFSILAKLHKNEDNLYLDKFSFASTYVYIVELLYKKIGILRRDIDVIGTSTILLPEFGESQKVVIIGIFYVSIRTAFKSTTKIDLVKYLIGYTPFGDVFFVSRQYSGTTNNTKVLHNCGLLNHLQRDHCILFSEREQLVVVRVQLQNMKNSLRKQTLISKRIQTYVMKVVSRLAEHFEVLKTEIPDFMLHNDNDSTPCFLDKLVFVCCMILNMLPRCAYN